MRTARENAPKTKPDVSQHSWRTRVLVVTDDDRLSRAFFVRVGREDYFRVVFVPVAALHLRSDLVMPRRLAPLQADALSSLVEG